MSFRNDGFVRHAQQLARMIVVNFHDASWRIIVCGRLDGADVEKSHAHSLVEAPNRVGTVGDVDLLVEPESRG